MISTSPSTTPKKEELPPSLCSVASSILVKIETIILYIMFFTCTGMVEVCRRKHYFYGSCVKSMITWGAWGKPLPVQVSDEYRTYEEMNADWRTRCEVRVLGCGNGPPDEMALVCFLLKQKSIRATPPVLHPARIESFAILCKTYRVKAKGERSQERGKCSDQRPGGIWGARIVPQFKCFLINSSGEMTLTVGKRDSLADL